MNDGIPQSMCDIREAMYESLGVEPLLIPERAPPCYCEYIVVREGSPETRKPRNAVYGKISGAFFVLKYVTSKITMNRIQIEVAQFDQGAIVGALAARYG